MSTCQFVAVYPPMLHQIRMGKLAGWRPRGHHERVRESYIMNFVPWYSISVGTEIFLTAFRPVERKQHCYCRRAFTFVYLPAHTYDNDTTWRRKKTTAAASSSSTTYALATPRYTMLSSKLQYYNSTYTHAADNRRSRRRRVHWCNSQAAKKSRWYDTAGVVHTYSHV